MNSSLCLGSTWAPTTRGLPLGWTATWVLQVHRATQVRLDRKAIPVLREMPVLVAILVLKEIRARKASQVRRVILGLRGLKVRREIRDQRGRPAPMVRQVLRGRKAIRGQLARKVPKETRATQATLRASM